jgi:GNAT superfamily N-acetyltransferase
MNIILEGLNTLLPAQYDFVRNGFKAGLAAGNFPEYRNGPTSEEMVVLAVNDFGPIGFATFYLWSPPETSEIVWLDLLWVATEHRRKSVGTRLLAAVVAYGERHGLAVEFGTTPANSAMQGLAKSFGLQPYTIGYRKEPLAA